MFVTLVPLMAASNAKTLKRLFAFKRSRFDATKKNAHNHTDFCNYNFEAIYEVGLEVVVV